MYLERNIKVGFSQGVDQVDIPQSFQKVFAITGTIKLILGDN